MAAPRYPSLYQINTRVWLTELSRALGRGRPRSTTCRTPTSTGSPTPGFDWIWLLSVWQTGAAGQQVSRTNPEWRREFEQTLPDLREEDIAGSGFAITGYTVSDAARRRRRARPAARAARGPRPAPDARLRAEPHRPRSPLGGRSIPSITSPAPRRTWPGRPANYTRRPGAGGDRILAHGRDPYFPGWPDTLQLDYGNPATQEAMIARTGAHRRPVRRRALRHGHARAAGRVRAHVGPARPGSSGREATRRVRERVPGFCFMAEVYWDLEWTLQQQGFDYTYDKRLYDRLREGHARPVREHLHAGLDFQDRLARFLENHDEPRAAATFGRDVHRGGRRHHVPVARAALLPPGTVRGAQARISPHLCRGPEEPVDERLAGSTTGCSPCCAGRRFATATGGCCPAGPPGTATRTWDNYVAYAWQDSGRRTG